MVKSRFSEEQIVAVLKEHQAGLQVHRDLHGDLARILCSAQEAQNPRLGLRRGF
jgi:hemerythrin-like domain-containing protein